VTANTSSGDASRLEPADVKQCCARLYESDIVSLLLGESYHPGGVALTERLGVLLNLTAESHVLDAASGRGTSALYLAQRFGCRATGLDLSQQNIDRAAAEAVRLGLSDRVRFERADAERLPLAAESVDAVICECAYCTFPDKAQAAREFARVLRPGGRVGLSDITRAPDTSSELTDLMAWIACLADARSSEAYAALLAEAGFTITAIEQRDDALLELIRSIGIRLFATESISTRLNGRHARHAPPSTTVRSATRSCVPFENRPRMRQAGIGGLSSVSRTRCTRSQETNGFASNGSPRVRPARIVMASA
jgi:SAM-dependent methyltransferase